MTTESTAENPDIGPDGWDKEAIYDAEIAPLMQQVIAICQREKIPLFASFAYRDSDETGDGVTSYCTTHLPGPNGFHQKYAECLAALKSRPQFAAFAITSK